MSLLTSLRNRNEWKFFAALPKADGTLASVWWAVVLLHGILPALFAIAMGVSGRRGTARGTVDRSLNRRRRDLRPAAGADANSARLSALTSAIGRRRISTTA